ncbi:MAG: hypothetical protein K2N51_13230 [Lachnospiraceae bacterium]|nr:hypothetical protein [Lachnospiraceae bacterium]
MNFRKVIIPLTVVTLSCFLVILFLLLCVCTDESDWLANVFAYKLYMLGLVPLYVFGTAYIDRQMRVPAMIRIGQRTKVATTLLSRKCKFAFAYLCTWFMLVNLFTIIKYNHFHEMTALDIIHKFFRYLLGFILVSIIAEIFSRSGNKYLSGNSYLGADLIPALEMVVIVPEIRKYARNDFNIVFSWIFWDSDIFGAYVVLITMIAVLLFYLYKVSVRKDIL